ncbi:MAG: methionyl-tRNA formyltransferase, partial [Marinirhabdus sp.]
MKQLRIVFMGTPAFAVSILEKLMGTGHHIVAVVTAPDRPSGRGRKLNGPAVKKFAAANNLPVLQPTNLKSKKFLATLKSYNANLQVVVAFRMLPKVVWQMPEHGTFNLHASLLPQYRGAAPIHWAIINGETKTGATTFFIDEKIDTGEIIHSAQVEISPTETFGSLHTTLMRVGSGLVVKTVGAIATGNVQTKPQPKDVHYKKAPKLTNENTRINWDRPVAEIGALVRGLDPWPVAWTELIDNGTAKKMKVHIATIQNEKPNAAPGTVFAT